MSGTFREVVRFGLVGIANTVVGLLAIYAVMYFMGVGPVVANAIGYLIGLALSFSLNRLWTFSSSASIRGQLPRYLLVAAGAYACNLLVVVLATRRFSVDPYLAQPAGVVVYTCLMFVGSKFFVFGRNPEARSIPGGRGERKIR